MTALRQLYDEQGRPLVGKGATRQEAFTGLLHGASHVWLWHRDETGVKVLVQKRSQYKTAWPGLYTCSAGGHIDLDEAPIDAAIRETSEEIGLELSSDQLVCIGMQRVYMEAGGGIIENEFEWVYLAELENEFLFSLDPEEVAAVEWKKLDDFKEETLENPAMYLPWGPLYFLTLNAALEAVATQT